MKVVISQTSNFFETKEMDITTLEQLINLLEKESCPLILSKSDNGFDVEIYDDFRE